MKPVLFLASLLCATDAMASTLCAKVTDVSHYPLPSASIAATHLVNQKTYTATADKNGRACFAKIPEGLYKVEAGLTGFLYVSYHPVRVTAAGPVDLSFVLPIGEITEGGVGESSSLNGTLVGDDNLPVAFAQICLAAESGFERCMVTDELGEYAFIVPPAVYRVRVRLEGSTRESTVDVAVPGNYRNRISVRKQPAVR